MKLFLPNIKSTKGFTLIELLVVIAIIGILAAALIATIDPLEQIRKGQDTTLKTTAVEYLNANTRYYGSNQRFVWNATVTGCTAPTTSAGAALTAASITGCTAALITAGELKASFDQISVGTKSKIFVQYDPTSATSSENMVTCFIPESKSGQLDPNARYSAPDGSTTGATCKSLGGTNNTNCYWCAR